MCFVGETLAKYRYFSVVLRTTVFAWYFPPNKRSLPFPPKTPDKFRTNVVFPEGQWINILETLLFGADRIPSRCNYFV